LTEGDDSVKLVSLKIGKIVGEDLYACITAYGEDLGNSMVAVKVLIVHRHIMSV
jgi:hypothetical protein